MFKEKEVQQFVTGLKRPFAIGIDRQLVKALGCSRNAARRAIEPIVTSREYLQLLLTAEYRYHANGGLSLPPTAKRRAIAKQALAPKPKPRRRPRQRPVQVAKGQPGGKGSLE